MVSVKNLIKENYSEMILFSIIFLFFLQMLSNFVETIYAFALLNLEPDENILALLFFFSPLLLLFFKKAVPNLTLLISGETIITARVLEPLFKRQLKMVLAGIAVASFLVFLLSYF